MTKTFGLFGAAAAAAAMALSGCGGGGGGVSGVSAPPPTVVYSKASAEAATAAAVTPTPWWQGDATYKNFFSEAFRQNLDYLAVIQPSAGVVATSPSSPGPVLPPVIFTVPRYAPPASPGPFGFQISYVGTRYTGASPLVDDIVLNSSGADAYGWRPASSTQDKVGDLHRIRISARTLPTADVERVAQAVFITDYDKTANDNDESAPNDNPDTPIDETVDHPGDDADYMAAGIWVAGPPSGDDPNNVTIAGAVAMGKVPYAGIGSVASTNTAVSYNGHAVGKRFAGGRITDFTTTVSLTANFDTDKISGTVADVGGGQKLKLLEASVGTGSGGPFSGSTELLDKDGNKISGYAGTWGGAFFNDNDPDTPANVPPGTAGTFGVSGGDPSESVLGAFIAKR